jgi:DNA-binding transcriptional regulator GbsR (MarR family)
MKLQAVAERFVLHWGEMGSRWGVNRTVAQIHALLYLTARPMDAEEIGETLGVARSNVSTSLKELQGWGLVRVVHAMGERRDRFATSTDVWELFRLIVEGRRRREFDPTLSVLRDCLSSADLKEEDKGTQARLRETLRFMETLTAWADEILRLPPAALMRIMAAGATLSRAVRRRKAD